jgi:hypothetical protein
MRRNGKSQDEVSRLMGEVRKILLTAAGAEAFSPDLQASWKAWKVMGPDALRVDLAEGHCVDMAGCLRIAEALMPGVRIIATYSGSSKDTVYIRNGSRGWWGFIPLPGDKWEYGAPVAQKGAAQ